MPRSALLPPALCRRGESFYLRLARRSKAAVRFLPTRLSLARVLLVQNSDIVMERSLTWELWQNCESLV